MNRTKCATKTCTNVPKKGRKRCETCRASYNHEFGYKAAVPLKPGDKVIDTDGVVRTVSSTGGC